MTQPELIDLAKHCHASAADCFDLKQRPPVEHAIEVLYDMELTEVQPKDLTLTELEFIQRIYRGLWKDGCK